MRHVDENKLLLGGLTEHDSVNSPTVLQWTQSTTDLLLILFSTHQFDRNRNILQGNTEEQGCWAVSHSLINENRLDSAIVHCCPEWNQSNVILLTCSTALVTNGKFLNPKSIDSGPHNVGDAILCSLTCQLNNLKERKWRPE